MHRLATLLVAACLLSVTASPAAAAWSRDWMVDTVFTGAAATDTITFIPTDDDSRFVGTAWRAWLTGDDPSETITLHWFQIEGDTNDYSRITVSDGLSPGFTGRLDSVRVYLDNPHSTSRFRLAIVAGTDCPPDFGARFISGGVLDTTGVVAELLSVVSMDNLDSLAIAGLVDSVGDVGRVSEVSEVANVSSVDQVDVIRDTVRVFEDCYGDFEIVTRTLTAVNDSYSDSIAGASANYHYPIWKIEISTDALCYVDFVDANGDTTPGTYPLSTGGRTWYPCRWYKIRIRRASADANVNEVLWPAPYERAAP